MVEKNRAEVNFELVERLAERKERDWTYFGQIRHEREKKRRVRKRCSSRPPACGNGLTGAEHCDRNSPQ
jgi:hypothetical protein